MHPTDWRANIAHLLDHAADTFTVLLLLRTGVRRHARTQRALLASMRKTQRRIVLLG